MNIRPKVIISVFNNHEVLLKVDHDSKSNYTTFIPVGGGVDFGETLVIAALRELEEEIQIKNVPLKYLGFHEYIFKTNNVDRHELMFHYACPISNIIRKNIPSMGVDNGQSFKIKWFTKEEVKSIKHSLVPPNIYSELQEHL